MTDPARTYVDTTVVLAPDVQLLPGTILQGRTVVGAGSVLGPDTHLVDTVVGEGAVVRQTVARESEIGDGATVGPYVSLRPGTRLATGAHVGTFVEIKNSEIGEGAKVPHLSYVGDAEIGAGANIGAGNDHRELRRRAQAPHQGRQERPHRLEHRAGGAGRGRRRRLHRRRVGREPRRAAGCAGEGRARPDRRGVGREARGCRFGRCRFTA